MDKEFRKNPFFRDLSDTQFSAVKDTMKVHSLRNGEYLFRQEEPAERFFLVTKGLIKLFRLSADGEEKVIEIVPPQHFFAEAVMFWNRSLYPVNAQATETTEVLAFSNKVYLSQLKDSVDTCLTLLGSFSHRLHQRLIEIDSLTLQNATYRLVYYLLELAPPNAGKNSEVHLPASKGTIASQLSIQPETFSRILANLARKKLIQVESKTIHLYDPEGLRQIIT